ncbi:hypothetical protein BDF22DRAFT_740159 [Syncephalis plumigaleata]|nr:hypothetical protein BDF22DRAFT_740159 [Syncephalis plumigaleata]
MSPPPPPSPVGSLAVVLPSLSAPSTGSASSSSIRRRSRAASYSAASFTPIAVARQAVPLNVADKDAAPTTAATSMIPGVDSTSSRPVVVAPPTETITVTTTTTLTTTKTTTIPTDPVTACNEASIMQLVNDSKDVRDAATTSTCTTTRTITSSALGKATTTTTTTMVDPTALKNKSSKHDMTGSSACSVVPTTAPSTTTSTAATASASSLTSLTSSSLSSASDSENSSEAVPKTPDTPTAPSVHIRTSQSTLPATAPSVEKIISVTPLSRPVESFLETSTIEPFPDVPEISPMNVPTTTATATNAATATTTHSRVNQLLSESMPAPSAPSVVAAPKTLPSIESKVKRLRQRSNTYGSRSTTSSGLSKDLKLSIDTKRANDNGLLAAAAPFSPLASSPLRATTTLEPEEPAAAAAAAAAVTAVTQPARRRGRANTITRIVVTQPSSMDNSAKSSSPLLTSQQTSSGSGNGSVSSGDENDSDSGTQGGSNGSGNTTKSSSTKRSFDHYPSVGELLWHNPLMYSDVRLRFEDNGVLASNCSLPTVLHLHSIVLLQARFFRDRLTKLDELDGSAPAPGPGNPVDLLIRLPAQVSRVEMCAFHLTIKLMYTKQFARELNNDLERAIGVLGVCNDLGFKEGVQASWCWLAQRCARDKRIRLWERLCDAYPTLERKFRSSVDTAAMRLLLTRSSNNSHNNAINVPSSTASTASAPLPLGASGHAVSSGFTSDEDIIPVAWPDLKVGASVEFQNTFSAQDNATTRAHQRRGMFLGPMRNVAMYGELSGGDNSRESSPRIIPSRTNSLPDVLRLGPPILESAEHNIPSDTNQLSASSSLDSTTATTAPSSPVESSNPANLTQIVMNATSIPMSNAIETNNATGISKNNGHGNTTGSNGTRGRRRSSFNPPRPSAKVLAQCSEPNDPATARRRVLIHWLAKFESRALDASVGHFSTTDHESGGSVAASPVSSRSSSPSRLNTAISAINPTATATTAAAPISTGHRRVASSSHPILIPPPVVEHPAETASDAAMNVSLSSSSLPASSSASLLSATNNSMMMMMTSPSRRRRASAQSPAPHLLDTVRQLVESNELTSAEAIGYVIRILEAVRLEQTSGPRPCMVLGSEAIDRSLTGVVKHALTAVERTRLSQWLDIQVQDEELLFQPMALTMNEFNGDKTFWFLRQTAEALRSLSQGMERSSSETKELEAFRTIFESSK